jgi:hypothetical protein
MREPQDAALGAGEDPVVVSEVLVAVRFQA